MRICKTLINTWAIKMFKNSCSPWYLIILSINLWETSSAVKSLKNKMELKKKKHKLFQQHTFGSNIPRIIFLQKGLPVHWEKGPPWIRTYMCCEFLVLWQMLHWFDWDPFTCLTKPWLHNQWGSETFLDCINFQVYLCCYWWIFCH